MIGKFIGGLFGKVVDNAEGILDKVITTDKERDEAKLALRRLLLDAETEAFKQEVEDRKSAREMYKDDAFIQKVLATLFTAAYFGLSFMMNGDGTATTLFTLNDLTDPDMVDFDGNGTDDAESYFDVYTSQVIMGQNNILGSFVFSGTRGTHPVRGTEFNSELVNFGKIGGVSLRLIVAETQA